MIGLIIIFTVGTLFFALILLLLFGLFRSARLQPSVLWIAFLGYGLGLFVNITHSHQVPACVSWIMALFIIPFLPLSSGRRLRGEIKSLCKWVGVGK
jgi:hypothetical protein